MRVGEESSHDRERTGVITYRHGIRGGNRYILSLVIRRKSPVLTVVRYPNSAFLPPPTAPASSCVSLTEDSCIENPNEFAD